jgi:hypothetical protein
MLVSHAIRQAKYKLLQVLTKEKESDVATSKDQYLPKLDKASTRSRHNARVEIYGAISRLNIYGAITTIIINIKLKIYLK